MINEIGNSKKPRKVGFVVVFLLVLCCVVLCCVVFEWGCSLKSRLTGFVNGIFVWFYFILFYFISFLGCVFSVKTHTVLLLNDYLLLLFIILRVSFKNLLFEKYFFILE